MSEKNKYIKLQQYNEIVIFPCIVNHSAFKHLKPISAGFCHVDTNNKVVHCYGESIGLSLKSDKEDTNRATMQIFGVDACLEYMRILEKNV